MARIKTCSSEGLHGLPESLRKGQVCEIASKSIAFCITRRLSEGWNFIDVHAAAITFFGRNHATLGSWVLVDDFHSFAQRPVSVAVNVRQCLFDIYIHIMCRQRETASLYPVDYRFGLLRRTKLHVSMTRRLPRALARTENIHMYKRSSRKCSFIELSIN